jgi:hypothetical protein
VAQRPVWFAYQDGGGEWTPLSSASGAYAFQLTSDVGAVAYVVEQSNGTMTTVVEHKRRSQFEGGPTVMCPPVPSAVVAFGSVTGLDEDAFAYVGYRGFSTLAVGGAGSYLLQGNWSGVNTLTAYSFNVSSSSHAADRCIIRRNLGIANGSTIAPLDMNGSESFAPQLGTVVVGGVPPGSTCQYAMTYWTGGTCLDPAPTPLYQRVTSASTFSFAGIPANKQQPADVHTLRLVTASGDQTKVVDRSFGAMATQVINLPPSIAEPAIAALPGNGLRLRASFVAPMFMFMQPYAWVIFGYDGGTATNSVSISYSYGSLESATVVAEMPDLESAAGWQGSWLPVSGGSGNWSVSDQFREGGYCEPGELRMVTKRGTY